MTEEQIEKLAEYVVYLRDRMRVYREEDNDSMMVFCMDKIDAVRDIATIFKCRKEVFEKVYEMED